MMRSLGETQGLLLKAAIGAGLNMGQAEDCAAAGLWLIRYGIDGAAVVLDSLTSCQTEVAAGAIGDIPPMQVARDGAALLDLALVTGQTGLACPGGLDVPLLMLGISGLATAREQCRFRFSFANGASAEVSRQGLTLKGSMPPAVGCDITFSPDDVKRTGIPPIRDRIFVPAPIWDALTNLAARTYVPASDHSRHSGAGAGLTDND